VIKENDEYRPYDTLKAIGFSKDEAKGFLTNIESSVATQLPPELRKPPEIEIKFRAQKSEARRLRLKHLLLIGWGYAFAVWLYVITIQFLHPTWIYVPFVTWLPIRMDYIGEAAFVASFIIITAVTMWSTRPRIRIRQTETEPHTNHKP
jgi:hypothetical protein